MIRPHGLMKYLGLTIATAYILSIGPVYAAAPDIGGSGGPGETNPNVTSAFIAQVQKNLMNAKQADESGNLTLAFREAEKASWYLDKLQEIYRFLCDTPTARCFG